MNKGFFKEYKTSIGIITVQLEPSREGWAFAARKKENNELLANGHYNVIGATVKIDWMQAFGEKRINLPGRIASAIEEYHKPKKIWGQNARRRKQIVLFPRKKFCRK